MALIELSHITQAFFVDRRKTCAALALDDVSLKIEEGEFVSLIGPSGCGKTVTLSIMAGFLSPLEGEALYRGEPIVKPDPSRGVVFQEYSLLPWLSVRDNLVFALKQSAKSLGRAFDKQAARAKADEALAQVGLADIGERRPNTLSGGMKQRVAIARLLAMDSDVFLMDEPFSALDEQTRAALDESVFKLWQQRGKTIVFVTHNISEAVLISSRIVMFSGSPGRVIHEWKVPLDIDRSLGSPEITRLASEIRAHLQVSGDENGERDKRNDASEERNG